MSAADVVLALPRRPRTALILGAAGDLEQALAGLGVRCLDPRELGAARPDLVVTAESALEDAIRHRAPAVILTGGGGARRLARAGYEVRRFLPVPDIARAQILLPLSRPVPIRYAIGRGALGRWKRLRNRLAVAYLARGLRPPGRSLVSVASTKPGPPFLVAKAERLGVPRDADWVLFPAGGDVLSRGAFHIFPPDQAEPSWVLKFARVRGYSEVFDRDRRGLELARSCGEPVAAHAPRSLGSLDFEGLHASLETAAVGKPLAGYLISAAPRNAKLRVIEHVAEWLLELSVATAVAPHLLDAERERIRAEILPKWEALGAAPRLVDDLPPVPGVLQHNDLGTWNVIVRPPFAEGDFVALDWEDARRVGMPLWDLWYFLQHALAQLDGASGLSERDLAERELHAVRLFRGELPASAILFEWTRRVVGELGIPDHAVGSLATLSFLHHGLSQAARGDTVRRQDAGDRTIETLGPRMARRWLCEEALGPTWDRWR